MAHPNDALIERFYTAFDAGDGATMSGCYAPDVHFSDPVFPDLNGNEAGAMWRMLTAGKAESGLRVELHEHEADDERGSGHWIAHYNFTRTGRPVVNDIQATFQFKDGLIADHKDVFDFYKWSRQALGPPGLLLGWSPIVKGQVRGQAAKSLEEFIAEEGEAK